MTVGDWTGAAQNIVQTCAIIVGGVWAYYKFVKGRTFYRRAELTVNGTLLLASGSVAVRAQIMFQNTGAAKIPLRAKIVEASVYRGDVDDKGRAVWHEFGNAPLFAEHDWLESQETIVDDILIPVPDMPHVLAYCVTAKAFERRGNARGKRWGFFGQPRPGGAQWTGKAVVLPPVLSDPQQVESEG